MPIERHQITDRESWLTWRKQDVTASAVGALFGAHPYETMLGLYAQKCGLELPEPDTAMLEWRLILESAVGASVARQRPGWTIVKATEYLRDSDLRLGATPDFYIYGDPRGLGVLQAKTVAPVVFKQQWTDDTPPLWIALQNATELMLEKKAAFGAVAALIIDPWKCECPIYDVPRHAGAEARIETAVKKFWIDVENHHEPAPDFAKDGDLLLAMYPKGGAAPVDLTQHNRIAFLCEEKIAWAKRKTASEKATEVIDAEITSLLRNAERGVHSEFNITWKPQKTGGYTVEPGTTRVLRVTRKKSKGDEEEAT